MRRAIVLWPEEGGSPFLCPPPIPTHTPSLPPPQRPGAAGGRRHGDVAHRHLLLLSLASSFAGEAGASHVAICSGRDRIHADPPQPSESTLHLAEAALESLDPPLWLLTPLAEQSAAEIVGLGQKAEAPWHHTWSCWRAGAKHCGACPGCAARRDAFAGEGVAEAEGTYAPPA